MEKRKQSLTPFLTFNGKAQEAMEFYCKVIKDTDIEFLDLYTKDTPMGDEGKVMYGSLKLKDQLLYFMDMPSSSPAPAFSWSTSLFLNFETEEEFDQTFQGISKGGVVMMGPEAVLGIRKCAWVSDVFGVTWQLIWE